MYASIDYRHYPNDPGVGVYNGRRYIYWNNGSTEVDGSMTDLDLVFW
eukprot:gene8264-89_t